ncbi:hypothetical protein ACGFIV_05480 [Sphaerisporangium sp. NPDC049003]|uniref:hypothetical protein n=1 Tax=Sphaerisporangium sp. NPDC049003 TaxID=3364517 RepID=UPI003716F738
MQASAVSGGAKIGSTKKTAGYFYSYTRGSSKSGYYHEVRTSITYTIDVSISKSYEGSGAFGLDALKKAGFNVDASGAYTSATTRKATIYLYFTVGIYVHYDSGFGYWWNYG